MYECRKSIPTLELLQESPISKLHLQKHNARTCKNYKQITTDTGTRTVREALPFKAKGKPAKGEHKKRRKSDMLKVIRAQDQEYAGKHLRPYFNGWFYQPRLAAANRRLTETTLPELKATKWVPINKRTGAGGYHRVDPRRKKSLKTMRKLYNSMRALDRYLNPGMGPFLRKDKSSIDYVDLGENSDEGKLINHTDSETSSDEYNKVSHMSFLTLPQQFGAQSGDKEWHDNKGRFKIPKVEAESNQEVTDETDGETAAGIEVVQLIGTHGGSRSAQT